MKKIMFNDRYGLTQAVLDGKKTMTRRIIPDIEIDWARRGKVKLPVGGFNSGMLLMDVSSILQGDGISRFPAPTKYQPKYEVGETVAIAQAYETIRWPSLPYIEMKAIYDEVIHSKGWKNKMFVRADLMPHRIRITDIKVEKLQDISIEDCEKEGIIHVNWRQYLKQDIDDFSPQPYKDHNVWTLPIFEESFLDSWAEQKQGEFAAVSPDIAFAVLIDKISGKGTWMRNPWVFAYEFELTK